MIVGRQRRQRGPDVNAVGQAFGQRAFAQRRAGGEQQRLDRPA